MSNQNLVGLTLSDQVFEIIINSEYMCVLKFFILILEKGSCCMNLRNYQEVVYLRRMLELKIHCGVSLKY